MSKWIEKNRRKDICITCDNFKPIKAKKMCQNCWHKIKRKTQPEFFLRTRYTELRQRCIKPNTPHSIYYFGLDYCTREEFLNKFKNNKQFLKLFNNWKKNDYLYKLCPSIDRIDKKEGYVIDNIQFIPHGENSSKDNENKLKVDVYTINGVYLESFTCLDDAVRKFDVQQSNAWKVLYGERKQTEGYVFKFTDS